MIHRRMERNGHGGLVMKKKNVFAGLDFNRGMIELHRSMNLHKTKISIIFMLASRFHHIALLIKEMNSIFFELALSFALLCMARPQME